MEILKLKSTWYSYCTKSKNNWKRRMTSCSSWLRKFVGGGIRDMVCICIKTANMQQLQSSVTKGKVYISFNYHWHKLGKNFWNFYDAINFFFCSILSCLSSTFDSYYLALLIFFWHSGASRIANSKYNEFCHKNIHFKCKRKKKERKLGKWQSYNIPVMKNG